MRNPIVAYIAGTMAGFVFGCLFRFDTYFAKDRGGESIEDITNQRQIYIVTPTYARPQQKAELTRLSYTLRLAGKIHWIVVEDSSKPTVLVSKLLRRSALPFTQLHVETPPEYKLKTKDPSWLKPRGVLQRNAALRFLREETPATHDSVVYFADDDNTYDVDLFEEMRLTKKVSVWPVGLVGGLMVERPIVVDGRIKRFNAVFRPDRPYPIDMAAFATRFIMEMPGAAGTSSTSEEDDLTIPRAAMNKMLKELLPNVRIANESRELVLMCCTEFIHHIATQANSVCNLNQKKTINAEHILTALDQLGFSEYREDAQRVFADCKEVAAKRRKQSTRLEHLGVPEEELLRQQQELFARARQEQAEQAQQDWVHMQQAAVAALPAVNDSDDDEY